MDKIIEGCLKAYKIYFFGFLINKLNRIKYTNVYHRGHAGRSQTAEYVQISIWAFGGSLISYVQSVPDHMIMLEKLNN